METIAAQATAKGKGALGIIRLSGDDSIIIAKRCLQKKTRFSSQTPGKITLNTVVDSDGHAVDQITAIKYIAPNSYTGENMVEFFCHGGEWGLGRILQRCFEVGAQPARPGEFTQRAFFNGKMDLVKAEAINGMIESRNRQEYDAQCTSYFGTYKKLLESWKKTVSDSLCFMEAQIEFGEEDDVSENNNNREWKRNLENLYKEICDELDVRKKVKERKSCLTIPIIGIPNAGKSSLFNLLLHYERALVHDKAGTTRDFLTEKISINETEVCLMDTAGIRSGRSVLEKKGIEKSYHHIVSSPIIFFVTPANKDITSREMDLIRKEKDKRKILGIISKIDCSGDTHKKEFFEKEKIPYKEISCVDKKYRLDAYKFLEEHLSGKKEGTETGIIQNIRHERCVEKVKELLELIVSQDMGEEIVAFHLIEIVNQLGEFTGETTSQEILNTIFRSFCIGK